MTTTLIIKNALLPMATFATAAAYFGAKIATLFHFGAFVLYIGSLYIPPLNLALTSNRLKTPLDLDLIEELKTMLPDSLCDASEVNLVPLGSSEYYIELEKTSSPLSSTQSQQNPTKNRYYNIYPGEVGQVLLEDGSYINASEIFSFLIAAQGPIDGSLIPKLHDTVFDFWNMVMERDAIAVVSLCTLGNKACANFLSTRYINQLNINQDTKPSNDYSNPTTTFSYTKGKEAQTITQYQCNTWADNTALDSPTDLHKIVLDFERLMESGYSSHRKRPLVVHCSAGVGRTGTLIFAWILFKLHKNGLGLKGKSLAPLLSALRQKRPHLVRKVPQWELVYQYAQQLYSKEGFPTTFS